MSSCWKNAWTWKKSAIINFVPSKLFKDVSSSDEEQESERTNTVISSFSTRLKESELNGRSLWFINHWCLSAKKFMINFFYSEIIWIKS